MYDLFYIKENYLVISIFTPHHPSRRILPDRIQKNTRIPAKFGKCAGKVASYWPLQTQAG
jgi:hypothetical protein